jgi:NADPH-dependent glutamate synthase beta subunit-like oxidoreductase
LALEQQGRELAEFAPDAASALSNSLLEFRSEWEHHATEGICEAGVCSQRPTPPCRVACPAGINIPGFLALIGHGQYNEALQLIEEENPFPYSCGLVCPAPCEDACLRKGTGKALFIRPLKAVAARYSTENWLPAKAASTGKRVAILGAGPSGLTLAYYLAIKGHQVEVFEAREKAGGMMRYGIPRYRLPAEVLDGDIDRMKSMGIEIHTGYNIESLTDFQAKGFDAIYMAVGFQLSKGMGVEGEDLPFVIGGMEFLGGVGADKNPRVGPKVIVIGGGNSAVDAAMTAFRQGAEEVKMVYRRRRSDMPASQHEVSMALAEGVVLHELWVPERITADHKMYFTRNLTLATAEDLKSTGEKMVLDVDHVLVGIGQESELTFLAGSKVETKKGQIVVDPVTSETAEPGVFAGGDVAHGASTVVAAIMAGKKVAQSIDAFLMGAKASKSARPMESLVPLVEVEAVERSKKVRPPMPELNALERRVTFEQIELGYCEADAKLEAGRCLRCDLCIGCGLCELVCSESGTEALRMQETPSGRKVFDDFTRPISLCIGCGACAAICPTGAIRVVDEGGMRATIITGTEVRRQPLLFCDSCHKPLASEFQYGVVRDRLAFTVGAQLLCPSCRRISSANSAAGFFEEKTKTQSAADKLPIQ